MIETCSSQSSTAEKLLLLWDQSRLSGRLVHICRYLTGLWVMAGLVLLSVPSLAADPAPSPSIMTGIFIGTNSAISIDTPSLPDTTTIAEASGPLHLRAPIAAPATAQNTAFAAATLSTSQLDSVSRGFQLVQNNNTGEPPSPPRLKADAIANHQTAGDNQNTQDPQTPPAGQPIDETPPQDDAIPIEAVPPYTDDLSNLTPKPVINIGDTYAWIIAIVVFVLFALFFAWAVKWLVTNALQGEDNVEDPLFQATDERLYRFDDYDDQVETNRAGFLHDDNHGVIVENDDDHHEPGEDTSLHEDENLLNDGNYTDESDDEPNRKSNFMSWLFGGRRKSDAENDDEAGSLNSDTALIDVSQDDDVIDVDVEPVSATEDFDETSIDDGANEENRDDMTEDNNDNGYIFTSLSPAPQPAAPVAARVPEEEEGYTQPEHVNEPISDIEPEPSSDRVSTPLSAFDAPDNPPQDGMDALEETLNHIRVQNDETVQSVARMEHQFVTDMHNLKVEVADVRSQFSSHQDDINRSMETRFAAISSNVENSLVSTQQRADEAITKVKSMSISGDLEKRVEALDEKVQAQNQSTDLNFSKLMQKLDTLSTPTPQLSRLSNDTAELKTQISAIQQLIKTPTTQPSSQHQDSELLNKLNDAMDNQQELMNSWRHDQVTMSHNLERLNGRMDRIEADLHSQNATLNKLLDTTAHVTSLSLANTHKNQDTNLVDASPIEEPEEKSTHNKPSMNPIGFMNTDNVSSSKASRQNGHDLNGSAMTPRQPQTSTTSNEGASRISPLGLSASAERAMARQPEPTTHPQRTELMDASNTVSHTATQPAASEEEHHPDDKPGAPEITPILIEEDSLIPQQPITTTLPNSAQNSHGRDERQQANSFLMDDQNANSNTLVNEFSQGNRPTNRPALNGSGNTGRAEPVRPLTFNFNHPMKVTTDR